MADKRAGAPDVPGGRRRIASAPRRGPGSPRAARARRANARRSTAANASESGGGSRRRANPATWARTPSAWRGTTQGGRRTDSHTCRAPPSARSMAMSEPEFPAPTTSTRSPLKGCAFLYSLECRRRPSNRPGHAGITGSRVHPVATTADRASTGPSGVASVKPAGVRSIAADPASQRSRQRRTREARERPHGVQAQAVGVPAPARGRPIAALEHDGVTPRRPSIAAAARPAGPAPTTTVASASIRRR